MSSFTKPFKVKVHNVSLKDNPFEVDEAFEFYSEKYNGYIIQIPKGYRSDFASVPRMFWGIVPPVGSYSKACVIHDWLITNKDEHDFNINEINNILKECMQVLGVSRVEIFLIYTSVNTFWKIRGIYNEFK
jgi:hypothetical protein